MSLTEIACLETLKFCLEKGRIPLRPRTTGGGCEGVLKGWVHDGKTHYYLIALILRYRLTPYKLQFSVTFFTPPVVLGLNTKIAQNNSMHLQLSHASTLPLLSLSPICFN